MKTVSFNVQDIYKLIRYLLLINYKIQFSELKAAGRISHLNKFASLSNND